MTKSKLIIRENRGGGDGPEVDIEVNTTGTEQDVGDNQTDEGVAQQQEHRAEPETQPAVMVVPKRKHKSKTRKPLKKSVIRRLCKLPSKKGRSCISGAAEIMYTNPEFDLESNIYSQSNCTLPQKLSNLKVRTQRYKPKRAKSKPRSTPKLKLKSKLKPRTKVKPHRNSKARSMNKTSRPLHANNVTYNPPQCLCTEINGEVYKVMDLPEGLEDLSSFLHGNRAGANTRDRRATGGEYRSTKRREF